MKEQYPDVWHLKKNKVDVDRFVHCLEECWEGIEQAEIDRLIDSMPRRLAAVKAARGWYTKY
ncbi:cfc5a8f4-dac1-4dd6-82b6-ad4bda0bf72b [Staphylotrichum tortipilum]|uniref:Cfc5a8f4-dac1-4dd6-82b6-ad4bda0bf72b n=1 Tax=Staphylotrichum tortipilum TaxID=2831512 RepID=A0AAN6RPK9_9PEZI|nr:cfc5a8f4-dac1-4dd6-82b6-ad4bda0bf72b [Staphylotrichum longicolle]